MIDRGQRESPRPWAVLTDVRAVLILLALTAVTAWGHFGLRHRLNDLDTLTFYIPWYGFMGERLRAFDIPGWMPYQFSGTPFAADPQSGWMYFPAMVFFALLSGTTAQAAFLVFHWLLAGLSTFAFARLLGMRQAGALAAAVALEFGTFIQQTHISLLRSQLTAWLPLALVGIELSLRARRWSGRAVAWAVTGIALSQVLAAWVGQGAYLALLVTGSYLAYRTILSPPDSMRIWRDRLIHLTVGGGVILATTFGLNAAALLPRLEWNKRTNLAGGDYSALYNVGGRGWDFDRIVDRTTSYETGLLYWYIGVAVLTLATVGVVVAARRFAVPYFAVLTVMVIVLSLDDGPIHRVFYLLPKFETFHQHQPNRTLVVLSLSVSLLAGAAVDRLGVWTRYRFALFVPLLPIATYSLIALTLPTNLSGIGSPTRNAVIATVVLLLLAVVLGQPEIRARWRWSAQSSTAIVVAVIFLIWWDPTGAVIANPVPSDTSDQAAAALVSDYGATSDPDGAGEFLQIQQDAQQPFRYFGIDSIHWQEEKASSAWIYNNQYDVPEVINILPPPRAVRLNLDGIQGYNPVHILRYDEYFEAMNGQDQNYHVSEVLRGGVASPLIDLLNVRYIVVPSGVKGGWDGAELIDAGAADRVVFSNDQVRVLENDDASPRAWIVHEARTVAPGDALPLLANGSINPGTVALIETEAPNLARPPADANESVTVLPSSSPDKVRLSANLSAPGLVVLSEIYDPGWHAYVDGTRVPVLVTNHILRSVPVPAGNHTIEFRFEPAALTIGLAITGVTASAILALGCAWGLGRRSVRRPRRAVRS